MYQLEVTTKFKKDLKKIKKSAIDFEHTTKVLKLLQQSGFEGIPQHMKPHQLIGNYKDCWECHIKPDLLIIWLQFESPNIIRLVRIGSHSDLFK